MISYELRIVSIAFCLLCHMSLANPLCFNLGDIYSPDDLPLTLVSSPLENDQPMVFFISGDGGWIEFDQKLAESIANRGMPVMGLDARKYFWKEKTPERATSDLSAAITRQMRVWKKKSFVLIGFSFGASIVPFVANRLPTHLKKSLRGLISISPDEHTDFEIHIADMLNIGRRKGEYNVLAEMQKLDATEIVCFFGQDEDIQVEAKLAKAGIKLLHFPGGHHYEDNYRALTDKVYQSVSTWPERTTR